jgi:hypothetical protein
LFPATHEATPQAFCDTLKRVLADTAEEIDREFPHHAADVAIGPGGEPTVKRTTAREIPVLAVALHTTINNRVPPRNLLDVLLNIDHWTGFTRHFGPLSGDGPRLRDARARYLLATFAIGTGLGVNQAARHLANHVTPHQLSYANRRGRERWSCLDHPCRRDPRRDTSDKRCHQTATCEPVAVRGARLRPVV